MLYVCGMNMRASVSSIECQCICECTANEGMLSRLHPMSPRVFLSNQEPLSCPKPEGSGLPSRWIPSGPPYYPSPPSRGRIHLFARAI